MSVLKIEKHFPPSSKAAQLKLKHSVNSYCGEFLFTFNSAFSFLEHVSAVP